MNIKDLDLNTGAVMIRYGKGGKTRMVFIGRTTRRSMRAYLRLRQDSSPALFISKDKYLLQTMKAMDCAESCIRKGTSQHKQKGFNLSR